MRRVLAMACACAMGAASACAQNPPAGAPVHGGADSANVALIRAGFGSLKQENIAIKLQLPDVLVKLVPLDEGVIRVLSADSYRALHDLAESKRTTIARVMQQHGLQRATLWYVTFYGLAPDARFSPQELTITGAGRDYRPVDVIPFGSGFGNQRLQPRETQAALYVFDGALDVNLPLVVSLGGERSAVWTTILRDIEKERASIRSR